MMDHIKNDAYVCFTCLQESTDPKICSHCGAVISEDVDESFKVQAPSAISLQIDFERTLPFTKEDLFESIDKVRKSYFDNFLVNENGNILTIECNTIAEERMCAELGISETDFFGLVKRTVI